MGGAEPDGVVGEPVGLHGSGRAHPSRFGTASTASRLELGDVDRHPRQLVPSASAGPAGTLVAFLALVVRALALVRLLWPLVDGRLV